MKTDASRKYVTLEAIRRANATLMSGERQPVQASSQVRGSLPSREQIVQAGNNAVGRMLAKAKVHA
jgi:hypothetical protein